MADHAFRPYAPPDPGAAAETAAAAFRDRMRTRRSVRHFSDRAVERATIEAIEAAAGKRRIREAAEAEEQEFYGHRAPPEWLAALAPFETNPSKPFLEVAPWLIVVFRLTQTDDGSAVYYGQESVGIACGLLLAAVHHAGLCALTHTPSPMGFLQEVLERPEHERPFLLIPVGYAADDCQVPDIQRKPLEQILVVDPAV